MSHSETGRDERQALSRTSGRLDQLVDQIEEILALIRVEIDEERAERIRKAGGCAGPTRSSAGA